MRGRIVQITVSPGGVPKRRVPRARVTRRDLPGRSQVYARVIVPGEIAAGDSVTRLTPAAAAGLGSER